MKLEIYEKKNCDLATEYGLSKSPISTISNKEQVRKLNDAKMQLLSPTLFCIQSDLEDILLEWMTLNLSRRIPMNQKMG